MSCCPICGKAVHPRKAHVRTHTQPSIVDRAPTAWIADAVGRLMVHGVIDGGRALVADTLRHPVRAVLVIVAAHVLLGMVG